MISQWEGRTALDTRILSDSESHSLLLVLTVNPTAGGFLRKVVSCHQRNSISPENTLPILRYVFFLLLAQVCQSVNQIPNIFAPNSGSILGYPLRIREKRTECGVHVIGHNGLF